MNDQEDLGTRLPHLRQPCQLLVLQSLYWKTENSLQQQEIAENLTPRTLTLKVMKNNETLRTERLRI